MSSASHDFPIFGAPARMNSPCVIRLSTTNPISFSGSVMISSQLIVFNFVNNLSSINCFLVNKNILERVHIKVLTNKLNSVRIEA